MRLAVRTLERNQGEWNVQSPALPLLVGFDRLYVLAHKCNDGLVGKLNLMPLKLQMLQEIPWPHPPIHIDPIA